MNKDNLRLESYMLVEDRCPFCNNIKRKMVLMSHPTYEGFYNLRCGFCGLTPRIEDENEEVC